MSKDLLTQLNLDTIKKYIEVLYLRCANYDRKYVFSDEIREMYHRKYGEYPQLIEVRSAIHILYSLFKEQMPNSVLKDNIGRSVTYVSDMKSNDFDAFYNNYEKSINKNIEDYNNYEDLADRLDKIENIIFSNRT